MKQSVTMGLTGERSALNKACVQTPPSLKTNSNREGGRLIQATVNTKESKAWFSFKSLASKAFLLKNSTC